MRRALLLAGVALLPLLGAPAPAQEAGPRPAAAQARPSSQPQARAARIRTGQHTDRGRVVLHLGQIPPYTLSKVEAGYELRLRGARDLDLSTVRPVSELAAIEPRREGEDTILLLRPSCDCIAEAGSFGGMLYVDLRPVTAPAAATAPHNARHQTAEAGKTEALRRRFVEDAVRLGLMDQKQAEAMLRAVPPASQVPSKAPAAPDEMAALRNSLQSSLAVLNGLPRQAPPGKAPPATATPVAQPAPTPVPVAPPKPSCGPGIDMRGWGGTGRFADRLVELRRGLAESDNGAAEAAALAEFYAASLLPNEALEVAETPVLEAPPAEMRQRLQQVRDIARLLRRMPIETGSSLLAERADCTRDDLALWQALAAAAAGDAATTARLAPAARTTLREVPERLRFAFAFALADGVGEDLDALRAIAGSIRTLGDASEAETAGRSWLLARIARLEGNRADEMTHLERAAQAGRSLPSLFARVRLAGLRAGRPGTEGTLSEAVLLDFARTYRFDALGEEAAVTLAERLLTRNDLAGALELADGATHASANQGVDSRAAGLAARILRLLLVDPKGAELPDPSARLALYWRYEGYATPGERGDDIRLGAMRLMLEQGLAEAALDTGRGLAPATAQTPAAATLLARAEAGSAQGDPQRALALLRTLPASDDTRRAAAAALARLGRPAEAARELEPLRGTADLGARAGHLYTAKAWAEAATAYAALLRDPALDPATRADATARYASAAALAKQPVEAVPAELLAAGDAQSTALMVASGQPAAAGRRGIDSINAAIERSKRIETLLGH